MEENEKKVNTIRLLIEKGKSIGKLTTHEIDTATLEMDFDIDELDKLYETIEGQNIEIIDDLGDEMLENLSFDIDIPKSPKL